jgi:hypothetical protein
MSTNPITYTKDAAADVLGAVVNLDGTPIGRVRRSDNHSGRWSYTTRGGAYPSGPIYRTRRAATDALVHHHTVAAAR